MSILTWYLKGIELNWKQYITESNRKATSYSRNEEVSRRAYCCPSGRYLMMMFEAYHLAELKTEARNHKVSKHCSCYNHWPYNRYYATIAKPIKQLSLNINQFPHMTIWSYTMHSATFNYHNISERDKKNVINLRHITRVKALQTGAWLIFDKKKEKKSLCLYLKTFFVNPLWISISIKEGPLV